MAVASKERVHDTKPVNPRIKSFKEFYKRLKKNKSALIGLCISLFIPCVHLWRTGC